MSTERRWDPETARTVAGVWRLLRRAGQVLWEQAWAELPRGTTQLVAWPADLLSAQLQNLVPSGFRGEWPEPDGPPGSLVRSAQALLETLPPGSFPEQPEVRALLAELVDDMAGRA